MRTLALGLFGVPVVFFLACGGGGEKPADPTSATSASATSPAAPIDAGPTTTTTMTLPDSGDLQGVKLQTATSATVVAVPSAAPVDGGAAPVGGHEPGRNVQDIMAIVQTIRPTARACYDAAVKTHPGIKGKIDIEWTIDPKGNVTNIGVNDGKSDIHEKSLADCIIPLIKGIQFAKSQKGFETRTHYPFDFQPHGNQSAPPPPG